MLYVPHTKYKQRSDRAFAIAAPKLWNTLPLSIRSAPTIGAFKSLLKLYILHMSSSGVEGCALCFIMWFCVVLSCVLFCILHTHTLTVKPKFIQKPSTFLTLSQFIIYSLENKRSQSYQISCYFTGFGHPSDRLSHKWIVLNTCQLLNLSTQLDHTVLGQQIIKQCLILFNLWYKKVTLAIKEKHLVRSKVSE